MNETCFSRSLGKPTVSAAFRTEPSDFRVREILGFEPTGKGEHLYVFVRKTGANTAWVAEQLAKYLGLRRHDVSYAGRKDRHAVAEQWFSCWLPGKEDPDWSSIEIEGAETLTALRHDRKLRRGSHEGNLFEIRLRDAVSASGVAVVEDVESRIASIARDGFPNYFGEQRFGHDGGNLVNADELLKGTRRSGKKKDIYLSAARSYLFNVALSKRVKAGTWLDEPEGWLPGIARSGEYQGNADDEAIDWRDGFRRLGLKPMKRSWAVVPGGLVVEYEESDMILKFSLPNGSYATSLLREVVDYG
jgi:tRNA pseudouridine13 synthase